MNSFFFGSKNDFAIESIYTSSEDKWIFGHLRLWIAGHTVGDFEDTVDLAYSARWGRTILQASSQRTRSDLDEKSSDCVYHEIYGRYFDRDPSMKYIDFDRDPFLVDDVGDTTWSDFVTVLIVRRGDTKDRIIIHDHIANSTKESLLEAGTFDQAINNYCEWVESL